jgi:hypothetical protein
MNLSQDQRADLAPSASSGVQGGSCAKARLPIRLRLAAKKKVVGLRAAFLPDTGSGNRLCPYWPDDAVQAILIRYAIRIVDPDVEECDAKH